MSDRTDLFLGEKRLKDGKLLKNAFPGMMRPPYLRVFLFLLKTQK